MGGLQFRISRKIFFESLMHFLKYYHHSVYTLKLIMEIRNWNSKLHDRCCPNPHSPILTSRHNAQWSETFVILIQKNPACLWKWFLKENFMFQLSYRIILSLLFSDLWISFNLIKNSAWCLIRYPVLKTSVSERKVWKQSL